MPDICEKEIRCLIMDAVKGVWIFFYYPSDEYIAYLMTVDELSFVDEIDCRDLFPGEDIRERIVVFEVL